MDERVKVPVILYCHYYEFLFLQKSLNLPIILQVCCYLLLTNITFLRIIKIRKVNFFITNSNARKELLSYIKSTFHEISR